MEHRVFQHPPVQILPHGRIADTALEKAFLKVLHLLQAFLRRAASDPAEQFIQVEVGKRSRNRAVRSLPDTGAPGEIAPQLPDVKVVVGREVLSDLPGPGRVVLIVRHEPALTEEVPALSQVGAVAMLIQLHHLTDALRDLRHHRVWILSGKGQNGFPIDLFSAELLWFKHNGYALRLHTVSSFLYGFLLTNMLIVCLLTKCRAWISPRLRRGDILHWAINSVKQYTISVFEIKYTESVYLVRSPIPQGNTGPPAEPEVLVFISSASSLRKRTSRSQSQPARSRPRSPESG